MWAFPKKGTNDAWCRLISLQAMVALTFLVSP